MAWTSSATFPDDCRQSRPGPKRPGPRAAPGDEIPITGFYALEAGQLEWEHGEPFDRLFAAQSLVEGFTLITADPAFSVLEGLEVLW